METLLFTTNIKCSGCVEKITPYMQEVAGDRWSVDLQSPEKLLRVENDGKTDAESVIEALKKAGYKGTLKEE